MKYAVYGQMQDNHETHTKPRIINTLWPGICGDNLLTAKSRPQRGVFLANHLECTDNLTGNQKTEHIPTKTNNTYKVALISNNTMKQHTKM